VLELSKLSRKDIFLILVRENTFSHHC
jgi:hypothetical protein